MILIIDEERTKRALDLKKALENRGLPTVFVTVDRIKKYQVFTAAVAFVSSDYMLNMISVRLGKCLLLCINDSGHRIYNKDAIFYDECYEDKTEFVLRQLKDKLFIDPTALQIGELCVEGDSVSVGLSFLKLTETEKNILVLAMLLRGQYFDSRTALEACFHGCGKNAGKVSVHICNLNKKARSVTGRTLICCKRGVGYCLDVNI